MSFRFQPLAAVLAGIRAALVKVLPGKAVLLRRAVANDGQFIFELSLEQTRRGHFSGDSSDPQVQASLAKLISCAIDDAPVPMAGPRNGAGASLWVLTVDLEPAGFAMFLEDSPGSWSEKVELIMVALREDYQSRGLGKLLVTRLLSGVQSKLVYARCRKPSTRMKGLLEARGFKTVEVSESGTTTLELSG